MTKESLHSYPQVSKIEAQAIYIVMLIDPKRVYDAIEIGMMGTAYKFISKLQIDTDTKS